MCIHNRRNQKFNKATRTISDKLTQSDCRHTPLTIRHLVALSYDPIAPNTRLPSSMLANQ